MKPEDQARANIDSLLNQAGWRVQDRKRINLGAGRGIAVREFSVTTGAADYLLFVDRQAVGIIEAKKVGQTLTGVEEQSNKYRRSVPDGLPANRLPLPFTYESTGIETRFTSYLDPDPRSRPLFAFHRPETLADWLKQAPVDTTLSENNVLRARLRHFPPLSNTGLRDCQFEAIINLEQSFAEDRPRALVQMATGSGKTYMAVNSIYRLIKFGNARRVLFLVDRANLGRQTLKEFQQYEPPDDNHKFTQLYNVQHLQSNSIDLTARVCITTIQRLYSILRGEPDLDPRLEEQSLFETEPDFGPAKEVNYNPAVPVETFDIVFTDECHRSIYNKWRNVLEYFDASIVGLTATPNKQTFGFFNRNLVMEYNHERAVTDGVNVDYQVFRIRTDITERGSQIEPLAFVGKRERLTRATRWEQLDEPVTYSASQLDRSVVAPDQIRTVIRAYRDALPQLFPHRQEVPKTLIFAKDDNHADEIVQIVREEFAAGNEFAQKITYKTTGAKPEDLIASFRNSYFPRVAVTVDMISTGTDIKPLEVLLFMRTVKSRGLFEQMKGRGSRVISDDEFQSVTRAPEGKTHFVIVDAVGVCEQIKTDDPPLDRKVSAPLKKVLDDVAVGKWQNDPDLLPTLAARLARLAKRAAPTETTAIRALCGKDIHELAKDLLTALNPDTQLDIAKQETGQDYLTVNDAPVLAVAQRLISEATTPFDDPDLRDALLRSQREEQIIDISSVDTLLDADWDPQAEEHARRVVSTFRDFLHQHRDEITALQIFYNRPRSAHLRYEDIKDLDAALRPLHLTPDTLWDAYTTLDPTHVRDSSDAPAETSGPRRANHALAPGDNALETSGPRRANHAFARRPKNVKRMLTDIVSLIRYTIEREQDPHAVLEPYSATVARRFAAWLADQQQQRGQPFTPEQLRWLELIRDTIASSLTIERADFEDPPFNGLGGLGKAMQLFGPALPTILNDLNERLAA